MNVFRSFNPNFTPVNVDAYDNLNFTISGQGTIEVAIMKEGVAQFRDQGKYLLELTDEERNYSLTKNHFKNDDGVSADWSDVYKRQHLIVIFGKVIPWHGLKRSKIVYYIIKGGIPRPIR